ncbi:MAG: hypothetical protein KME16_07495 [Scytolyngbya sp. HA4215-MV1]|jgi:hypothetical protein|nr:hypothetical protein [Scytolyngbya sp. HA4215-MV1]
MKLNQLIAVLNSVKANSAKAKAEVYQLVQKPALFQGQSRTFQPREEDGYVYPAENQKLTLKADELLDQFAQACTEFYDLAATQDWANTEAKASVVVDGVTIVAEAPVSYLLFLEKQLQDVKTFVQSLPVLAIDKDWRHDPGRGCYVTEPKETVKTKKITDFVVAYEATPEHPAQIKEVSKDIIEGVWSLVEFSGALPKDRVSELLKRVDKLSKAVVQAREEANGATVSQKQVANAIFGFLFA